MANVNDFTNKVKIFNRHVRDNSVRFKLKHKTIPNVFPEDEEEQLHITHRFILKCNTSDIQYAPLLKAICNQDRGIKPRISHDLFFL
ncbi:hypothetical protein SRABI96_03563 [Peribacillus sp. Bi96]|nr:hypothetical protein SRABI96_03563 [Peribacillus sp. Bi96]